MWLPTRPVASLRVVAMIMRCCKDLLGPPRGLAIRANGYFSGSCLHRRRGQGSNFEPVLVPVLGPTLVHKTGTFFCPAIISLIGESLRVPILGAQAVPVSGTLFGLKTDPVLCPSCFLNAGLGTCRA